MKTISSAVKPHDGGEYRCNIAVAFVLKRSQGVGWGAGEWRKWAAPGN